MSFDSYKQQHEIIGMQPAQHAGLSLSNEQRLLILNAVNAGIESYIQTRKSKVPAFVIKYFSFRGTLELHREALGKDRYKTPLNILWLAPLAAIKICSLLLNKFGAIKMAQRLNDLPSGLQTDVQNEINWLIYTELLKLPFQQNIEQRRPAGSHSSGQSTGKSD